MKEYETPRRCGKGREPFATEGDGLDGELPSRKRFPTPLIVSRGGGFGKAGDTGVRIACDERRGWRRRPSSRRLHRQEFWILDSSGGPLLKRSKSISPFELGRSFRSMFLDVFVTLYVLMRNDFWIFGAVVQKSKTPTKATSLKRCVETYRAERPSVILSGAKNLAARLTPDPSLRSG
jgi:hypothetical protein